MLTEVFELAARRRSAAHETRPAAPGPLEPPAEEIKIETPKPRPPEIKAAPESPEPAPVNAPEIDETPAAPKLSAHKGPESLEPKPEAAGAGEGPGETPPDSSGPPIEPAPYFAGAEILDESGRFKPDVSYLIELIEDIYMEEEFDSHPRLRDRYHRDLAGWLGARSPDRPEPPLKSAYMPRHDRDYFQTYGLADSVDFLDFDEAGRISRPRLLAGQVLYNTLAGRTDYGAEGGQSWFETMAEQGAAGLTRLKSRAEPGSGPPFVPGGPAAGAEDPEAFLARIISRGRPDDEAVAQTLESDILKAGPELAWAGYGLAPAERLSAASSPVLLVAGEIRDSLAQPPGPRASDPAGDDDEVGRLLDSRRAAELAGLWNKYGQKGQIDFYSDLAAELGPEMTDLALTEIEPDTARRAYVKLQSALQTSPGPDSKFYPYLAGELKGLYEKSVADGPRPPEALASAVNGLAGTRTGRVMLNLARLGADMDIEGYLSLYAALGQAPAQPGGAGPGQDKELALNQAMAECWLSLEQPGLMALLPKDYPHDLTETVQALDYMRRNKADTYFIALPGQSGFELVDGDGRPLYEGETPIRVSRREAAEIGRALAEGDQGLAEALHQKILNRSEPADLSLEELWLTERRRRQAEARLSQGRSALEQSQTIFEQNQAEAEGPAPSLAEMAAEAARAGGVDGGLLLGLALAGSRFDPRSPGGLFGLTKPVAEEHGLDLTAGPEEQMAQAAGLMNRLFRRYMGNQALTLLAFRDGRDAADEVAGKALEGEAMSEPLKNYVGEVSGYARLYNQAGAGLDFSPASRDGQRQLADMKDHIPLEGSIKDMLSLGYSKSWSTKWLDKIFDLVMGPDAHGGDPNELVSFYDAVERGYLVKPGDFKDGPLTLAKIMSLDSRNRISGRFQATVDLVEDGAVKTLTNFGLDMGIDPLSWVPGTVYAKLIEKGLYAGRVGAGVARNAARLAKGEDLTKFSEITSEATKKMLDKRQEYFISGQTSDRVSYSEWRNGPQLKITNDQGKATRLLLKGQDELSFVKEIGGDKLAEHIENAARISADMPNEMKQAVGKGLETMIQNDRPAAEQLAKILNKKGRKKLGRDLTVEDLPNMIDDIGKVMDKTLVSYVDESGKLVEEVFISYNQMVYNRNILPNKYPGDMLINGLPTDIPGVKPTRVSGAHAEVLGTHSAGETFKITEIKRVGGSLDPVYKIPENAIMVKIVSGRPLCGDCKINIPTQARAMGVPRVLLFEADTGKTMFWKSSMKDQLIYIGNVDRSYDAATIAAKGSAMGVSKFNSSYEQQRSKKIFNGSAYSSPSD